MAFRALGRLASRTPPSLVVLVALATAVQVKPTG
jgi:hypothetical protein